VEVVQEEERVQTRCLIVPEGAREANAGALDRGLAALDNGYGPRLGHVTISVMCGIIGFDLMESVGYGLRVGQGDSALMLESKDVKKEGVEKGFDAGSQSLIRGACFSLSGPER
jgi:hypothetical protein